MENALMIALQISLGITAVAVAASVVLYLGRFTKSPNVQKMSFTRGQLLFYPTRRGFGHYVTFICYDKSGRAVLEQNGCRVRRAYYRLIPLEP